MPRLKQGKGYQVVPYLLVGLLACLSYFPSLSGDFILDDHPLVKDNLLIREAQGLASYFSQEDGVSQIYGGASVHTGYYRPLINLTYRLDYRIWGLSAPGFRVTNLLLHGITSLTLLFLLGRFSGHGLAAFLGALFFALHPVNSEAVSWISSRNNILVAFWSLLAFGFHLLGWERDKKWAFAVSTLCFGGAVFSKEFGLMVLPFLFLYHRVPAGGRRSLLREFATYVPLALVVLLYFWLRGAATGGWPAPGAVSEGFLLRIFYAPYLALRNMGLFFFPCGLHSFIVGYPSGFFTWQALAGFSFLTLCGVLVWKNRRRSMFTLGVAGFFLTLLPVLNVIPTSSVTLVSMRWLYLPILCLVFAVTDCLVLLLRRRRAITVAASLAVAAYLGVYTGLLNAHLWRDEGRFFRQEVLHFQNFFYAGGLAEKLQEEGRLQEAEPYFRIALSTAPSSAKNFINYSALLIDTGRPGEAIPLLEKAGLLLMTIREGGEWANNMGMALFGVGKVEEAIRYLTKAVEAYPMEPAFWANLGAAHGAAGDLDAAEAAFKRGLARAPHSELLKKNLAVTYRKIGERARTDTGPDREAKPGETGGNGSDAPQHHTR